MMYFAVNHDEGTTYTDDMLTSVESMVEEWISEGIASEDITIYCGKVLEYDVHRITKVIVKS